MATGGRRGRRYRHAAIAAADLFLATTPKARDALLLEGVDGARIEIAPPGIDTARFAVFECLAGTASFRWAGLSGRRGTRT